MKTLNKARFATSFVAAIWLVGCGSSGTMVSPDQAAQFKPGVTTETEVIAKLGPSNSSSTYPDGSKTDMYLHVAMAMHAANFIPVVGIFAGGASHSTDSVTFTFDPRGVLKTTASNTSHQDMNSGLLNQK
jgi:outer membrane protein assembly factor BamE (lipoprotein component of BamABCDE complex)